MKVVAYSLGERLQAKFNEVVELIDQGLTVDEIAVKAGISKCSVDKMRFNKLLLDVKFDDYINNNYVSSEGANLYEAGSLKGEELEIYNQLNK